jgi:N-methylhydantoinase A
MRQDDSETIRRTLCPSGPPVPALTIGLDVGGTFVDCVAVTDAGGLVAAKAPTTPDDPVPDVLAALTSAADAEGLDLPGLLGRATAIVHGTTLGLNALLAGRGGRVAMLTTRGHEDAVLIGRVHQKVAGLRPHELIRISELRKPEPLVPRTSIFGIHERVDSAGNVVVPLDEDGVRAAADRAVAAGCEAIVVAFLWSFLRPDHERRAAQLIEHHHPSIPVVRSSEVAPVLGEYERTTAAIVDAALRKPFAGYLDRLGGELGARGFRGRLWLMGMTGGVIPVAMAARHPVETLRSGPIGGVLEAGRVAGRDGDRTIIATDMGGTSFDVGLVLEGEPPLADVTLAGRFHLAIPAVEVRSIGAGGGSIAWVDDLGGLHVGPTSAGANPGPACYGLGGTEPTVTDADVVLGRLDPDAILAGGIRLDHAAAEAAIGRLAVRLGTDPATTAAGIVRVADAQMADLIRTATVESGRDPRSATLVAYGGAGPLHVGRFGSDVGVAEAIVPGSASVLAALGLARAGYRRTYRRSRRLAVPLDASLVSELLAEMRDEASSEFTASGLPGELTLRPWVDLRYRRQTHQLRVPLRDGLAGAPDGLDLDGLYADFDRRYERTYGAGTAYAAAGMEATAVGLLVLAPRRVSIPVRSATTTVGPPARRRRVWFDLGWVGDTPVFEAETLEPGVGVEGPAVIEWPTTSLVVHPGQRATMDEHGDVRLRFGSAS